MGQRDGEHSLPAQSGTVDPEQARFFLALGAVGEPLRAAELAGVSPDRARAWLVGVERPAWMQRRSEAARQLFQLAGEALAQVRRALRGEVDPEAPGPPLRELVSVAERFFSAALKLDSSVGADGQARFYFELDGWTADTCPVGGAGAAPDPVAGDA
jgi:hypothetical protein